MSSTSRCGWSYGSFCRDCLVADTGSLVSTVRAARSRKQPFRSQPGGTKVIEFAAWPLSVRFVHPVPADLAFDLVVVLGDTVPCCPAVREAVVEARFVPEPVCDPEGDGADEEPPPERARAETGVVEAGAGPGPAPGLGAR